MVCLFRSGSQNSRKKRENLVSSNVALHSLYFDTIIFQLTAENNIH